MLAKGVKGIAISPVDPPNETDYLNTVAAKTNLITSDSDAPNSNRLCYIGTDNHAAGVMAGGLIKKAIPGGGKIILFVGKSDAQNAKDRISGIQDALKGSNIQIIDTRTDDADHARAKQNAADAIVSHPDLAGMVGIWSYNGPAIYSAVKGANKQGKIQIVAFDQEEDTMTGIKDGTIYGTIVQQPYQFGYKSIEILDQLAHGDKSGIPASKLIIIPTQAITKSKRRLVLGRSAEAAGRLVMADTAAAAKSYPAPDNPDARSPALEMQGISKRFVGVQALKDVSLAAYPGEVLALISAKTARASPR